MRIIKLVSKIPPTIVHLFQEKGVIQMYYDKWWKSHGRWPDSGNCLKKEFSMKEKAAVNALGVVNIGGVFVVLLVGLAFAVTVAIGEFCWKTSSLNMKSENIIQTSPLRRNSRKFTSIERRRSRKSLCAEIARTLMPRLICDSYGPSNLTTEPNHSVHHHNHQNSQRDQETLDDISEIYHYMPAVAVPGNFPR